MSGSGICYLFQSVNTPSKHTVVIGKITSHKSLMTQIKFVIIFLSVQSIWDFE